jgi:hypothetical protein
MVTTWMVRGLSPDATPAEVAADLDLLGLEDRYDYLYLPGGRAGSKGYCFVNFAAPGDAELFSARLQEETPGLLRLGGANSPGVWIRPAQVQGTQANLGHLLRARKAESWQKGRVDGRPWVRLNGQLQPALPLDQVCEDEAESLPTVPRTLMLRGLPNKMTSTELMDILDALGFEGAYDYFYLPCDLRSLCNKGYAFINLMSEETVVAFQAQLNGHKFQGSLSTKEVAVSPAKHQGVRANLLRCSSVNCSALLSYPWVQDDGEMKCLSSKDAVREFAHRLPSGRAEAKGTSPTSSADLSTSASDKETSPTGAADLSTSASDASSENGETQQPPLVGA